jgi:hypothetical protein
MTVGFSNAFLVCTKEVKKLQKYKKGFCLNAKPNLAKESFPYQTF